MDAADQAVLHHITSMSAWIAPAALIACRMPIKSRGPMPSPLRPSTSCCSDTPSFTTANFLPSSVTPTLVRGVTTVRPRDSGLGWLTCGLSEIVTVRLPWATATVATRTSRPITMMPERSSITILAARSGSTCNCSISVRKATTLPLNSGGDRELHGRGIDRLGGLGAEEIVDRGGDALGGGEIGVAQRQPHIGQAVERELDLALDDGAVGDAADGRHAADDLGGGAFGLETADRDRALRHRIDVAVGAEQGGDQQGAALQVFGVAERRDRDVHPGALGAERGQIAGDHHGGDVAGADGGAADIDAHRSSIACSDCLVKGMLLRVSPVPLRPTTRP